ncbi:MAG: RNA-binding protein [Halodesulfurarchaeum sp.]
MSLPFHYVDLRSFCYETEDEDRVAAALRTFLPDEVSLERSESEGHHGDRIVVLSTRVERQDEMRHVFARIRRSVDLDRIRAELDERIDENNAFFLQFDKQAAYQGRVELGSGIRFRAKVEAYPATRDAALENARDVLE